MTLELQWTEVKWQSALQSIQYSWSSYFTRKTPENELCENTTKIICSYFIEHYQYVQIEDKRSTLLPMFFCVPQESIRSLVLFNLYVAELADRTYSKTIHYANDTTLYQHCKISTLDECAVAIQKDMEKLLSWSQLAIFMSDYAIAVYFFNLLFSHFNFNFILYLSLRPLISLNFVFYRSINVAVNSCTGQFMCIL